MKELLLLAAWAIAKDGKLNWILTKGGEQISVPKRGGALSLTVFEDILTKAKLEPGQYWDLLPKTGFSYYADAEAPTDPRGIQ
jgi:hypothetical protein